MGERCEKRTMYTITCDECGREYGAWFDDAEDMRRQAYDDDWLDNVDRDGHRSWRCPDHWVFRCACCGCRFARDWTESDRHTGTATPHLCDDCLKAGRKPEPAEDHDRRFVLATRWGDRGKPDVTYKNDKGDKQ